MRLTESVLEDIRKHAGHEIGVVNNVVAGDVRRSWLVCETCLFVPLMSFGRVDPATLPNFWDKLNEGEQAQR